MFDQIVMHGPVQTEMHITVVSDEETPRIGTIKVGLCAFRYPTQADIKQRLEDFAKNELPKLAPGFRLATKREAWDQFCIEKAGGAKAPPGGDNWDEVLA